jgi:hypothetical protein
MGTKARMSQLRPHAAVRQWQARVARKTARAAGSRVPPGQRFIWPADRTAIVAETMAVAQTRLDVAG